MYTRCFICRDELVFFLSGSCGQGIAPTAPEMPEMGRYEVSDAQHWCFLLSETQNSTREVPTNVASRPEGDRSARRVRPPPAEKEPVHASLADRLLVERPSSSGPPGSSFGSLIRKSTKAEHQKLHIFPFLAFLEP